MEKKIRTYMKKWEMIQEGDHIVIGVSGGADSVCLFEILEDLKCEMDLKLTVVHINHGIRGKAADEDEQFVRELCAQRGIPCQCVHGNVKAYAKENHCSEEEAGRIVRREIFEKTADAFGDAKIALAHHQDDNAETFLLHVARGSKLKGLGGIYPVNGRYIRPLLCVTRKEIESFLEKKGTVYCMDATNAEDTYTRNRIRGHVIPYLESNVHAGAVRHINEAMEQLRELQAYMEKQTEKAYGRCVEQKGDGLWIKKADWMKEDQIIRPMLVHKALAAFAGKEKDLTQAHVQAVLELMEKQSGRIVHLPYQMEGIRQYGGVEIRTVQKKEEETERPCYLIPVKEQRQGRQEIEGMVLSWRVFPREEGMENIPKKTYTKWFDYAIIRETLCVRARKPGDRISIDSEGHQQKLKAYFINEKIPVQERGKMWLLAEGSDIWWVIGRRQGKKQQVTVRTKEILEITIDGGRDNGRKD